MKTNRRKKGRKHENYIAGLLKRMGYIVHIERPAILTGKDGKRFCLKADIFGADIVATSRYKMLFVQVTTDTHIKRKIDEFQKYPMPTIYNTIYKIIIQGKKRKTGWKYRIYYQSGGEFNRPVGHKHIYYLLTARELPEREKAEIIEGNFEV